MFLVKMDELVNLTKNEKLLTQFIKNNRFKFSHFEVNDICNKCFVSKSIVYRLCNKLGFNGIAELKMAVSVGIKDYSEESIDYDKNKKYKTEAYKKMRKFPKKYEC